MLRNLLFALTLCATVAAQTAPAPGPASASAAQSQAPVSTAKAEDVSSIDAILAATYDVISGAGGQKRDWDRFRSLFYPGARLIPTRKRAGDNQVRSRVITPEEYIQLSGPFLEKEGFFERSIVNRVQRYAEIAQVFSSYESRHNKDDAKPFERGINGFQLMYDGKRWWILSIMWEGETPEAPIPAEYLK
jgi:hypothetical protein